MLRDRSLHLNAELASLIEVVDHCSSETSCLAQRMADEETRLAQEHDSDRLEDPITTRSSSSTLQDADDLHSSTSAHDPHNEREGLLKGVGSNSPSLSLVHDIDVEATTIAPAADAATKAPKKDVSWWSLPHKDQLLILTFARLAEPLYQNSLSSYMFFMLQSFDTTLDDAAISSQAGILTAAFTAAQCVTAVWWGRLADKEWMGRKNIVMIGLVGSFFSSIGFGFSKSFWSAIFFRTLGGALNGNVGVMRTVSRCLPLWL